MKHGKLSIGLALTEQVKKADNFRTEVVTTVPVLKQKAPFLTRMAPFLTRMALFLHPIIPKVMAWGLESTP